MEKILTAEEFISGKSNSYDSQMRNLTFTENKVKSLMVEFAKLHVEAALKSASTNASITEDGVEVGHNYTWPAYNTSNSDIEFEVSKDSILNSYPSENIK